MKDLLNDFSEEVLKDLLTCTIDVEKEDYLHVNEAVLLSNDTSAMEQGEEPEILEAMRWLLPFSLAVEDTNLDTDRYLCHLCVGGNFDVGWVPKSAREGDRLCMFGGASDPFVLRERENGRFRLLGDAFMLKTTLKQALRGNFTGDQVMDDERGEKGQVAKHIDTEDDIYEQSKHGLPGREAEKRGNEDEDEGWLREYGVLDGGRDDYSYVSEDGGGLGSSDESDYEFGIGDPDNDWNAQDEEMQHLISGLQWIALQ